MSEQSRLSWETFTRTGDIEAYLLYKSTTETENQKDNDDKWRKSEREALS